MDTIHFDDVDSQKWYFQKATAIFGDIPISRQMFCTVGVGTNGTYEIYMYGGLDPSKYALSGTYAPSLPGFQWYRFDDTNGTSRIAHQCALAGNRQKISVGGFSSQQTNCDIRGTTEDPALKGLQVLNLQTMSWSDTYEPSVPAYDTPSYLKAWDEKGALSSVSWGSDQVKSLFVNGTMAGIAIGVVALLAAVAAIVTSWCRRLRRAWLQARIPSSESDNAPDGYFKPELDASARYGYSLAKFPTGSSKLQVQEMRSSAPEIYEMPTSSPMVEMSTTSPMVEMSSSPHARVYEPPR
ncbi:hypothetical protein GQ53DRAFT_761975 [Thozetella sp. PMI_491]|nr:hypothetical protein GQ53DRAFT_761975 [Thozetella sp. PMI_491]